jgi:hypothetical protein
MHRGLSDGRCGNLCLAQEKEQKAVMKTFTVNATVVCLEHLKVRGT